MNEQAKPAKQPHPATAWHLPFTRINHGRVLGLLGDDANSEEAKRRVRRLRWFAAASIVRAIGFFAGWVGFLTVALAVPVFVVLVSSVPAKSPAAQVIVSVVFAVLTWSFFGWAYLYFLIGVIAPSTRFAQKVRHVEQQGKPLGNRMTRTDTVLVLQASGGLARTFFRILTRRFFSAGVRPDLATDVAAMAQQIMLAVPKGLDAGNKEDFESYSVFLKDVLGLLIVQRLDKLEQANDKLRAYLQPLVGRASIDVLITVMLPIGAFVVSLGAFALSMIK
jgi:hypothetical protein